MHAPLGAPPIVAMTMHSYPVRHDPGLHSAKQYPDPPRFPHTLCRIDAPRDGQGCEAEQVAVHIPEGALMAHVPPLTAAHIASPQHAAPTNDEAVGPKYPNCSE